MSTLQNYINDMSDTYAVHLLLMVCTQGADLGAIEKRWECIRSARAGDSMFRVICSREPGNALFQRVYVVLDSVATLGTLEMDC